MKWMLWMGAERWNWFANDFAVLYCDGFYRVTVMEFQISLSAQIAIVPCLLAKSSICYNPIIYAGLNGQFPRSFKKMFGIREAIGRPGQSEATALTTMSRPETAWIIQFHGYYEGNSPVTAKCQSWDKVSNRDCEYRSAWVDVRDCACVRAFHESEPCSRIPRRFFLKET